MLGRYLRNSRNLRIRTIYERGTYRVAKIVKQRMPRGSKPGERRGGRSKGTPNKATVAKAAALKAASEDVTTTPLQFLLNVMRDPQAPTDLRIKVARAAAPLVHAKPRVPGSRAR